MSSVTPLHAALALVILLPASALAVKIKPEQKSSLPPPHAEIMKSERRPVAVSTVCAAMGWGENDWQAQVLTIYAGDDALVSVAEIETARDTSTVSIITPVELQRSRTAIGVSTAGSAKSKLDTRCRYIGELADALASKPDGKLTTAEINSLGKRGASNGKLQIKLKGNKKATLVRFVANQELAMVKDAVARFTGEDSPLEVKLRPKRDAAPEPLQHCDISARMSLTELAQNPRHCVIELAQDGRATVFNPNTNAAMLSITTYYGEDLIDINVAALVRPGTSAFYQEPELKELGLGVSPKRYSGKFKVPTSPWLEERDLEWSFARGHSIANDDQVTQRSTNQSFGMGHMQAQTTKNNSVVWLNKVEKVVRARALSKSGRPSRMVFAAGELYTKPDLTALSDDEVPYIGGGGKLKRNLVSTLPQLIKEGASEWRPIPTYSFKVVLEQTADNMFSVGAYVVANRNQLETKATPEWVPGGLDKIAARLQDQGCALLSLSQIEELTGIVLFDDLPKEIRDQIKDDPTTKLKPNNMVQFIGALNNGKLQQRG